MVNILWVGYPRSYTPGRRMRIMGVCLHYTAGSEGPNSAESGAAYDRIRSDGTSCHLFTDSLGPALREVPDSDRSHSARFHANEVFVHVEICGTIQTRAEWLDAVSIATLRTTASVVAYEILTHGLQARRMTDAEVRAAYYDNANPKAVRGICDHANCTRAFPEDSGDHLDVGTAFPWDVFMAMVHQELEGSTSVPPKLFILNDSAPANKVCISDGATYRWLTPAQLADVQAEWGLAFPSQRVTLAQAASKFGPDVATLSIPGPEGPPGPATLVPHNHKFMTNGVTSEAVPD